MTKSKRIYKLVCKASWKEKDAKRRENNKHRQYVHGEIYANDDLEALTTLGHIVYIARKELQGRDSLEIMVGCAEYKDRCECCNQPLEMLRQIVIAWYDGELWNSSHPFQKHFLKASDMFDYALKYQEEPTPEKKISKTKRKQLSAEQVLL